MPDAYIAGLTLLARRELSEAQLRQRLARRGHSPDDIDAAVARLTAEAALDDARVAGAIARTQVALRGRGRLRIRREIQAAGITSALADRIVDEVFRDVDQDALLAAAIERRLRGRTSIDDREAARLYRYLIVQGFDADRVSAAIRARRSLVSTKMQT
jgi:regulatory protein